MTARMFIRVSTSKPVQSRSILSGSAARRRCSRSRGRCTGRRTAVATMHSAVAQLADQLHVVGAAAVGEPRPLGEVRPGDQRGDVADDLLAVGRAVGIDHHDDVAGAGREPGDQGVSLALAALLDDPDSGHSSRATGRCRRSIRRRPGPLRGSTPGNVLKTYGRMPPPRSWQGITTLTGGAMARWESIWAGTCRPRRVTDPGPKPPGAQTELMSLIPLVRWTARPSGGPAFCPVRKGGFVTYGMPKSISVQAG